MSMISEYGTLLLLIACAFAFFMAWGVGANDVADPELAHTRAMRSARVR